MKIFQGLVQASKDRIQEFGAIKAEESDPRPTADSRSNLPSPVRMIPSYFLDQLVGNFHVKKVEGTDSKRNPFKEGLDDMTCDKHEIMDSFQGSVTTFQGLVTRLRTRKIEDEMKRYKFGRVWSYKNQGKWSKTYRR
ncbi:hypothetical protein M9H77_34403 [Catharanthus roseus]|uniref:Uncharacterized protein n=1 Tax=Catharanthus roseus TaxID=4058 RepID=A0ACB9ZMZ0_CATRO|nr:hypothetical protein M9H77_34403 [Catharanthus roseus]